MKDLFYTAGLLIVLFTLLFSCHKEAETGNMLTSGSGKFNDYMPLKVGAKYEYKFNENRTAGLTHNNIDAVCLWEFISVSADSSIYKVKETMNGYRITVRNYGTPLQTQDSTLIKDEVTIGTWVYSGNMVLTHTYDWFPRFLQSEAADTLMPGTYFTVRLRKNVGITRSLHINPSNYDGRMYTLTKGPYY